jgi:hypothetical protein
MRTATQYRISNHSAASNQALNAALPLIARPLNSCFPPHERPLAVRTGQCGTWVKNYRCPGANELNTSQKKSTAEALPCVHSDARRPKACMQCNAQSLARPPMGNPESAIRKLQSPISNRLAASQTSTHFPAFYPGKRGGKALRQFAAATCATSTHEKFPQKIRKGKRVRPGAQTKSQPKTLATDDWPLTTGHCRLRRPPQWRAGNPLHVGIDHHPHQLGERNLRLPAQHAARLRRITAQRRHLRRPE